VIVAQGSQSNGFEPIRSRGGYAPIADHGLIGDGATAALVERSGTISWLCAPRFDSPPVFASLLDANVGGRFVLSLADEGIESHQRYVEATGVLQTEIRGPSGSIRITDALTLRAGADLHVNEPAECGELVRCVEALSGNPRLRVEVRARGGSRWEGGPRHLHLPAADGLGASLDLHCTHPLGEAEGTIEMAAGERAGLVLSWGGPRSGPEPFDLLDETVAAWRRWGEHLDYSGPWGEHVHRSAITLKLLDNVRNGALVAAPTSSLPEEIGGSRNWDYRYSWIRDAAFSVFAMRRVGMAREGVGFLNWVLTATGRRDRPRVLYDVDGEIPVDEWEDEEMEGYRGSRPVRWGNGAVEQDQHDVYGEVIDCAYQWAGAGGEIGPELWGQLAPMIRAAEREWRQPDYGIWEVRSDPKPFTYSAAMCQVALDRGARLAKRFDLPADDAWPAAARRITEGILNEAWDADRATLTDHLGGGSVDAALLALPVRRVLPADHPKMIATCRAVVERLGAGEGLLYRYRPDEVPDGLPGEEGAFLLCSFWLAETLALRGDVEEAASLFESLCARANPVGLLPEQIDPANGDFLGNFPQALSHVGLIASAVAIGRRIGS
jgi:alpha,alpha-trehalase